MKKIFIFVVTFIFGLQTTIVYSQNLKVDFTWQLKHSCSKVLGCLGNFYDKYHKSQLLKKKPEEDSLQVFNNYAIDIYL